MFQPLGAAWRVAENAMKKLPRNLQHGCRLARDGCYRTPRLGDQRHVADERGGAHDARLAAMIGGIERDRARDDDIAAIRRFVAPKQNLAGAQYPRLRRNRELPQRIMIERSESRIADEITDIILKGHASLFR